MKLKKFKEKNRKNIGVVIFTIVCILLVSGVVLYRTFAIFEVNTTQNVIKGTVQDPGNLYFAFYKDGEIQKDIPSINEGYVLDEEQSYCGVNGSHDLDIQVSLTEDYRVIVSGMTTSRTKCNLYFVKGKFIQGKGVPIVEEGDGLYEVSHEDYTGEETGWKTTELRFVGKNPKNYIEFNEETWRIIGLVNVQTNDGIEQRLKIMKNESIGRYSWDSSKSSINQGMGVNDWKNAKLNILLNEYYLNSLSDGMCYTGVNETTTNCSFPNGLKNVQSKIENIVWNLGGVSNFESIDQIFISNWYDNERGNNVYVNHSTTWSGKIGLIYPSDFGYATSGNTLGTTREQCLKNNTLYNWNNVSDCFNNDWMLLDDYIYWTLTSDSSNSTRSYAVEDNGRVRNGDYLYGYSLNNSLDVYPVLYLKTNVRIMNDGQDGSVDKPYHLQENVL